MNDVRLFRTKIPASFSSPATVLLLILCSDLDEESARLGLGATESLRFGFTAGGLDATLASTLDGSKIGIACVLFFLHLPSAAAIATDAEPASGDFSIESCS